MSLPELPEEFTGQEYLRVGGGHDASRPKAAGIAALSRDGRRG